VESFGWDGYGIDVYSGGAPYLDNCLIKNSNFHDNGWYNVAVDRSTNVTVQDCTLSGGGTALAFFEKDGAPVTGGKVTGCNISGATYDGVRLVGSGVLVDDNDISGCATTTDPSPMGYGAVRITTNKWPNYAANNNTVTNNNIHDNLGNGVLIDHGGNPEPTGNVFHCNDIVNSAFKGFEASVLTSDANAENNWWGDASGPSGVGPGTGDAVSANVDFDPWLAGLSAVTPPCGFPPPTGDSTDPVGVGKDTYTTGETVYASGSGFPPNTNVDIYIVGDLAWSDGDPIPADVSGGKETVTTDGAGNLAPTNVWAPPLTVGQYDMVFDADQNVKYDAATDVVDDPNHPGFVVQTPPEPVGGIVVPVNKLGLLAPWLALVAMASFAALTVALVKRRRA